MRRKFGKGLIVGRFQPIHKGHVEAIRNALKECEEMTIAIGSAQEKGTGRNPFSARERKKMIAKSLGKDAKRVSFCEIIDYGNDPKWRKALIRKCGKFEVAYSNNGHVRKVLKKVCEVKPMVSHFRISGTEIRKTAAKGKKEWKKSVPKEIANEAEKKLGRQ